MADLVLDGCEHAERRVPPLPVVERSSRYPNMASDHSPSAAKAARRCALLTVTTAAGRQARNRRCASADEAPLPPRQPRSLIRAEGRLLTISDQSVMARPEVRPGTAVRRRTVAVGGLRSPGRGGVLQIGAVHAERHNRVISAIGSMAHNPPGCIIVQHFPCRAVTAAVLEGGTQRPAIRRAKSSPRTYQVRVVPRRLRRHARSRHHTAGLGDNHPLTSVIGTGFLVALGLGLGTLL